MFEALKEKLNDDKVELIIYNAIMEGRFLTKKSLIDILDETMKDLKDACN
jgi:hypothetical protein